MSLVFSVIAAQCARVPIPQASDIAMSYYRIDNLLWMVDWGWTFLFPLVWLLCGLSARVASLTRGWLWSIWLYVFLFIASYELLSLPISFYADYMVEHEYGLSTQTVGRWLWNYGMSGMLFLAGVMSVIWIFYWLLEK